MSNLVTMEPVETTLARQRIDGQIAMLHAEEEELLRPLKKYFFATLISGPVVCVSAAIMSMTHIIWPLAMSLIITCVFAGFFIHHLQKMEGPSSNLRKRLQTLASERAQHPTHAELEAQAQTIAQKLVEQEAIRD